MSRQRKNKTFHVYKGGKNDSGLTPLFGVPNTNLDTYDKRSGRFKSRRKYGNDGNARVDLDKAHSNKYPFDHAHDINTNNDLPRSEYHRPLTRQERREINKASKKRRFWKND